MLPLLVKFLQHCWGEKQNYGRLLTADILSSLRLEEQKQKKKRKKTESAKINSETMTGKKRDFTALESVLSMKIKVNYKF